MKIQKSFTFVKECLKINFSIASEAKPKAKHEKGLKIVTPKQML